jgi:hypothetical protein
MNPNRNRPLLITAVWLIGTAVMTGACSSQADTVSSTGTAGVAGPGAGAGTALVAPSAVTGSTATTAVPERADEDLVATADGGRTTVPQTTIPDPNTPVPPPVVTEPPTIPASGQDPAFIDCGIIYRASGWPTTFVPNIDAFTCLQTAFDADTPARLVDREQTDGEGGAILVTTYDVLGPGRVRVTVDAREAADRPQRITVSECTGLVAVPIVVTPSGCTVVSS